jgi:aminoglycoside phosphotransferase (APT) family kinase protein
MGDTPVAEPSRQVLGEWLTGVIPDADDVVVSGLEAPSQGFSNETWFFDASVTSGKERRRMRLVLRLQPKTSRVFQENDVMHEWRIMHGIADSAVPVPGTVAAETSAEILGAPFFVMERVDGRIPQDVPSYNLAGWVADLTPAARAELWRNGIGVLEKIHSVDWQRMCPFLRDSTETAPALEGYLRQIKAWYAFTSADRDFPLLATAMDEIERGRPPEAEVGLVWGDARPGNMIFADDLSVAAVLDWEMAFLGPGEADLGWWLFADRFYSEGFGVSPLPGLPTREEAIAHYEQASSRPVADIEYFELLAAFRMALIMVRSTATRVSLGLLDSSTTMDVANPATRMIAELLGTPAPPISPDFLRAVRGVEGAT